jgi:RAD50-interacting protein 1
MAYPVEQLPSREVGRVEDYVNDKLQTVADLDSLDSLLATLRGQHELQEQQVSVIFTMTTHSKHMQAISIGSTID